MKKKARTSVTKPHKNYSELVDKLINRGMIIPNRERAEKKLSQIGYYRLSGFWYPCRQFKVDRNGDDVIHPATGEQIRDDCFQKDINFNDIIELYLFDKNLRLLMLDAIERIEIQIRTIIAHEIGYHDPLGYLNQDFIKPEKCKSWYDKKNKKNRNIWEEWKHRLNKQISRSRKDCIVALPGLNRNEAYALEIKLPPPNEQERIADKIETLQVKTVKAKKALETAKPLLDKLRLSILASAFRGDLTADWRKKTPDVENAKKLLKKIGFERETAKKNSQTRYSFKISTEIDERFVDIETPSNWIKTNVDSVSIYIVDCAHSTPKWTTSGKICLRTTNFLPFKLVLDEVRYVSNETFQNRRKRLKPQNGDILYSREGGILGIACVLDMDEDVCLGQRMMMFRPSYFVLSKYFLYYLNSLTILKHVKNLVSGSAAPHINIRDIKKYPFPLPPFEEQKEMARQIDRLFDLVDKIEKHHQETEIKVDTLCKSILAKAYRGELVPQNPSDESALSLLVRIKKNREMGKKMKKVSTKQK